MPIAENDDRNIPKDPVDDRNTNNNNFPILIGSIVLGLICLYPWTVGLFIGIFLGGYLGYEHVTLKLKPYLLHQLHLVQNGKNGVTVDERENENLKLFDPLLHNNYQSIYGSVSPIEPLSCSVCSDSNCTRDKGIKNSHRHTISPGPKPPSHSSPSSTSGNISDTDYKIDSRLDAAVAKFCKAVFDTYIKPNWAPYETRKQLKLGFTKLLTSFAEGLSDTFLKDKNQLEIFCKEKVLPLLFYHMKEQRKGKIILKPSEKKKAYWKVRWLSLKLLEVYLPSEDQKCRLWVELCVSILGDGVLWNLIMLGRNEIPELIEKALQRKLELRKLQFTTTTQLQDLSSFSTQATLPNQIPDIPDINVQESNSNEIPIPGSTISETKNELVPFLLDSFLNPAHDVELADSITSRWRPTLKDILNESEKQFLYCLIQYLKGQGALEYLQAVLDQSPDGQDYCRRILELKYITGFCRSKIFLESLGFIQIEEGEDVIESPDSISGNRKPSHSRSSSYGGVGSGIFKIEQRVVDGFAIYPKPGTPTNSIPSMSPPSSGPAEPDSIFRRRQNVLDNFIGKFYTCVLRNGKDVHDILGEVEARNRCGVDTRSYEDEFQPDVMSKISIAKCDTLKATTNAVIGCITKNHWIRPMIKGWVLLAHPFVKTKWNEWIDEQISKLLTLEHFLDFINLITDAFTESQSPVISDPISSQTQNMTPNEQYSRAPEPDSLEQSLERNIETFIYWLLGHFFDPTQTLDLFKENRDQIILFFVDILDIFVTELITSTKNHCEKYKFQRKPEE